MTIEPLLRQIPFFDPIEDHALPELAQSLELIRCDAGQILFYENDPKVPPKVKTRFGKS